MRNASPDSSGGAPAPVDLVAVRPAAARPDERRSLAVLVVEEVGVDRSVEARIVEFDRKIVAALGGAFRPGGADLDLMRCTALRRLCGLRNYAER